MKNTALLPYLTIICILALGFGAYRYYSLSKNYEQTTTEVQKLNSDLSSEKTQNENLLMQLNEQKNVNDSVVGQIASITSTVVGLAKLNQTDPQLLAQYSKVYFLNEHYVPRELSLIDPKYTYNKQEDYFHAKVLPFLLKLIGDARRANVPLEIISAYRSFESQTALKSVYKVTFGTGANQFSADQGYSEHQLGTAVDFTTPKVGATFSGFSKTETFKWLTEHAHKYGFILSYPSNNYYYQFEPWHWRFVGVALAMKLYNDKMSFYDLDQREINRYLIKFFDPD